MLKKFGKLLVCLMFVLGILLGTVYGSPIVTTITASINDGHGLFINGRRIEYKEPNGTVLKPINYNGRVYIPVRAVAEGLGYPVEWGNNSYAFIQVPKYYPVKNKADVMLYDFYDAVSVKHTFGGKWMYISIDRTLLTPQIKGYKYISIVQGNNFDIVEALEDISVGAYPGVFLDSTVLSSTSRFDAVMPLNIILYNASKQPTGYLNIGINDKNNSTLQNPQEGVLKIISGAEAKWTTNYYSVFVDRSKLPATVKNFVYTSLVTPATISEDVALHWLVQYQLDKNALKDIREYDKREGHSVSRLPCIVYYMDDSKNVLGYSLIEK